VSLRYFGPVSGTPVKKSSKGSGPGKPAVSGKALNRNTGLPFTAAAATRTRKSGALPCQLSKSEESCHAVPTCTSVAVATAAVKLEPSRNWRLFERLRSAVLNSAEPWQH
jgi:hypothetical protein